MGHGAVRTRGVSLVELLVALAVASVVAAVVLVASAGLARQARHVLASARTVAKPADALAAMLADLRGDRSWSLCRAPSECAAYVGQGHGTALVANDHAWVLYDDGLRVCSKHRCDGVLASATALQVFASTVHGDSIRRVERVSGSAGRVRLVEVRLWLNDGSQRSRLAWLPP